MRLKPATAQTAPFEKLRREEEKEEELNKESQEELEMKNLVEEDKEYYYFEDPSNIGETSLLVTVSLIIYLHSPEHECTLLMDIRSKSDLESCEDCNGVSIFYNCIRCKVLR